MIVLVATLVVEAVTKAIYAGSFDPFTNGHLDIVKRASNLFDLTIVIAKNDSKNCLFSSEERKKLVQDSVRDLNNIKVEIFDGLIADYARKHKIYYLIRGLRPLGDFDKEYQMAQANSEIYPDLETVFLTAHFDHISSSLVKEVWKHGGGVKNWVPNPVLQALREKRSATTV